MSARPSSWVVLPNLAVDAWEPIAIVKHPCGCQLVLRSGALVHTSAEPLDVLAEVERVRTLIRNWEARSACERAPRPRPRKGRKRR